MSEGRNMWKSTQESQPQASLIPSDTESTPYVTLLTVQLEVCITLGTLKKSGLFEH